MPHDDCSSEIFAAKLVEKLENEIETLKKEVHNEHSSRVKAELELRKLKSPVASRLRPVFNEDSKVIDEVNF